MATFVATTASNNPRLNNAEGAQKILDRYFWDSDVEAVSRSDAADKPPYLAVYGGDWPAAWKIPDGVSREAFEPNFDEDSGDGFEQFLLDIATYLAEPLTIQAVGTEKCRFP